MSEIKTNKLSSLTGTNSDITLDPDGTGDTIISSGKVGIGTTSPDTNLQVNQTGTAGNNYDLGSIKIGDTVGIEVGFNNIGSGRASFTSLNNAGTTNNLISFGFGAITSGGEPTTNVMTLNQSGNVGIGVSSPARVPLHVHNPSTNAAEIHLTNTTSGSTNGDGLTISQSGVNASIFHRENGYLRFATNNTERMRIESNGHTYLLTTYANTTGGSANVHIGTSGELFRSTSSQRYKNTIVDATHGLTELLTLRPVTYKHNNDGDTIYGGLIAEEVHTAGLTEFVQYSEDDNGDDQPEALDYGNMVSLCIKAIQEQQATITALTARITALENA